MPQPKRSPPEHLRDVAWAKKFLDVYVRSPDTSVNVVEAYGLLSDHIVRLEQYIKLVDSAVEGAKRDLPDFVFSPNRPNWPEKEAPRGRRR